MPNHQHNNSMKKNTLLFFLMHFNLVAFSQIADSIKKVESAFDSLQKTSTKKTLVSGAVTVTNNGISLVPAFSLGKPAAIFDMAVRRNKFSFEPQLAFGFKDAKPWYFVFWLKYKFVETPKFNMDMGFHPGFVFSTTNLVVNGINKEFFTTQRFFVGALTPNYTVSKTFSIGGYYQYARGYNSDLKQSYFFGLNCNLSNIGLGDKFYMKALPQFYYLKNDDKDGFYISTEFTLAKKDFPLSVSTMVNKKFRSDIPGDDFLWNLSLRFSY